MLLTLCAVKESMVLRSHFIIVILTFSKTHPFQNKFFLEGDLTLISPLCVFLRMDDGGGE